MLFKKVPAEMVSDFANGMYFILRSHYSELGYNISKYQFDYCLTYLLKQSNLDICDISYAKLAIFCKRAMFNMYDVERKWKGEQHVEIDYSTFFSMDMAQ